MLELAAVERLCARARGREDLLEALRDIWHAPPQRRLLDGRRVAELDEAFHCALVEAAGNPEMAQVHRDVTEKIRIVRRLDFTKDFRIDATYEEHGAILSAVLARRADEAARLLRAHIGMSRAEVSKITLRMLHEARRRDRSMPAPPRAGRIRRRERRVARCQPCSCR